MHSLSRPKSIVSNQIEEEMYIEAYSILSTTFYLRIENKSTILGKINNATYYKEVCAPKKVCIGVCPCMHGGSSCTFDRAV